MSDLVKQYNDANAAGDEARRKAALAWLDCAHTTDERLCFNKSVSDAHRAVIKQMLAEPRLPERPPPEVLAAMRDKLRNHVPEIDVAQAAYETYHVLRAALLPTKPAWRVGYTHADNDAYAGEMLTDDFDGAMVHVRQLVLDGATVTIEKAEMAT